MKKNIVFFTMAVLSICFFTACKKNGEPKAWTPGPIEGYTVTPINGGATITYNIPRDPDIIYVMAEYIRNGKVFTEKSSVYKNSLTIEGFNTTEKVKVSLYKVNKQEQKSEPFELEFLPLKGLVTIAKDSLQWQPGFGGIIASWVNPGTTPLGVHVMFVNDDNKLETNEMYYTTLNRETRSFRGIKPKETKFAIAFEDKWGNISDTTFFTTTPYFETMIPKPYGDFRANVPYDNTTNYPGATHTFSTLSDNIVNTSGHGWLSVSGSSGLSITFDMKQAVKLSRVIIHGYHINSVYGQVNITKFEMWGLRIFDFDKVANRPYWLDEFSTRIGAIAGVDNTTVLPSRTFKDDWEFLGYHEIPRYDRMVPPDNQAVLNLGANGTEYTVPIGAKPVRYIRIFAREVAGIGPPSSNNYFSMGEISFYGDNTVPQP